MPEYLKTPLGIICDNSITSVIADIVNNAVDKDKRVEIHTLKSPMPNDDSINLAIYINGEDNV